MKYRQETFWQFIRKTKLPPVFTWGFNIGFLIILVFLIYRKDFWGLPFMAVGFIGIKAFMYIVFYRMYSAGGKAIRELGEKGVAVIENIEVRIIGFELYDIREKIPSFLKTIYIFDKADIVLAQDSMILLGTGNPLGGKGTTAYAYPVELTNGKGNTTLTKAKIDKWIEDEKKIHVQISDPHYKKPIRIEMKDETRQIKQWLEQHI